MPVYNRLGFMGYNNIRSASIDDGYLNRLAENANTLSESVTDPDKAGINETLSLLQ